MAAKIEPTSPLPKSWAKHVRSAMLHVISLARYATPYTGSWAADGTNARARIAGPITHPPRGWPSWNSVQPVAGHRNP